MQDHRARHLAYGHGHQLLFYYDISILSVKGHLHNLINRRGLVVYTEVGKMDDLLGRFLRFASIALFSVGHQLVSE